MSIAIDIDDDIVIDMVTEETADDSEGPFDRKRRLWMRHWMKHTAIVPKGFLRYQLLKLLNEKLMSGSEIMSELENQTQGYWKPSPGSIYPLLSWLQDKGYISEADVKEPGIRRYTLTEQGRIFLGNEAKSREEIERRIKQFRSTGGFFGPMWFGHDQEDAKELGKTAREFGSAARGLFRELRKEHSKEATAEARKALEGVTKQILDIMMKLQA